MKHRFQALSALLGIPLVALGQGAQLAPPPTSPVCESLAFALRRSSFYEAFEESWEALAFCVNEEESPACNQEILQERLEAIQLAFEQYDARLEVCSLIGSAPYTPELDPGSFSADISNPYLPQIVGRTLVYEKVTEDETERVEVTALDEVVEIGGILCRSVRDVVYVSEEEGEGELELVEDTTDWFSMHSGGDVWYLGEISRNYEDGLLADLDGSWRHGHDGAFGGLLQPGAPLPGDAFRQEFLIGEAEDMGRIVSLDAIVDVPAGHFEGCLETEEWTPIEPGVFERKYYAPGIGLVLEVDLESGERLELVDIVE